MKLIIEGSSNEIYALISAVQKQKEEIQDVKVDNEEKARKQLEKITNGGISGGSFKLDVSYEKDQVESLAYLIRSNFHNGSVHIMLTYPEELEENAIKQYIRAIHLQSDQKYIYSVEKKDDMFNCHIITDGIDERTAHKRSGENAIIRYGKINDIESLADSLARYIVQNSLRYTKSRNCTGGGENERADCTENANNSTSCGLL